MQIYKINTIFDYSQRLFSILYGSHRQVVNSLIWIRGKRYRHYER